MPPQGTTKHRYDAKGDHATPPIDRDEACQVCGRPLDTPPLTHAELLNTTAQIDRVSDAAWDPPFEADLPGRRFSFTPGGSVFAFTALTNLLRTRAFNPASVPAALSSATLLRQARRIMRQHQRSNHPPKSL